VRLANRSRFYKMVPACFRGGLDFALAVLAIAVKRIFSRPQRPDIATPCRGRKRGGAPAQSFPGHAYPQNHAAASMRAEMLRLGPAPPSPVLTS